MSRDVKIRVLLPRINTSVCHFAHEPNPSSRLAPLTLRMTLHGLPPGTESVTARIERLPTDNRVMRRNTAGRSVQTLNVANGRASFTLPAFQEDEVCCLTMRGCASSELLDDPSD